jgi:SsrA-binding protein
MAKKGKRKAAAGDIATNRKASHKYEFVEKFEAGIQLQGSEVKSMRDGGVQIADAYATISDEEVWLHGVHIAPYAPAALDNHEPDRPRKLLLHRYEIERLIGRLQRKGFTLVPTRLYFKEGRAKVELAVARGKEQRDRRREIRDRDVAREIERELAQRNR